LFSNAGQTIKTGHQKQQLFPGKISYYAIEIIKDLQMTEHKDRMNRS